MCRELLQQRIAKISCIKIGICVEETSRTASRICLQNPMLFGHARKSHSLGPFGWVSHSMTRLTFCCINVSSILGLPQSLRYLTTRSPANFVGIDCCTTGSEFGLHHIESVPSRNGSKLVRNVRKSSKRSVETRATSSSWSVSSGRTLSKNSTVSGWIWLKMKCYFLRLHQKTYWIPMLPE